ncbi:Rpn family recombination-promoting nuclease/putative transposase [Ectothiorhodospira variabilis]|uniref:Rpn family recombination-promoting nuclease/putative transposase n=1 Tax=Ectothiorhodospira variabilis TaxID=505694 RepID=UPI001EFB1A1D|nr:Rpn family recombination-promoting nuclease/putative transposase [Ectothiorhodospira variabilis]MCG5495683.1 Rpn family recombination-promoting nuclease/putative transposase [Ectothiorhodospira variabilis]MCG5504579.1 Rpn family recombination-promoting nuclease/putative transposase [Ectothiorhodospira variabilis]MCG5507713.1 Rpn family recombination-promoting nuclease/putative transposase [Ectothiorhodospira variabilis]
MGNTLPNPHDTLFKALLEDPERAGALLRESLPKALTDKMSGDPQPVDGSFIDENLRGTHSDRLFQVALQDGRTAFIYTLIEHKSWPDMGAPLQLMGYRHRIWTRYAQDKPERLRTLPPIITLLVYHGRTSWDVPTRLIDCIDADEDLLELQRDGRYTVKDLTGSAPVYEDFSDHPLLRAGLAALAWAFVKQFHPEQLARLLRDLPDEHPLTRQILIYIVRVHTMTENEFKQGVAMAKPHLVEALTMSLAQEWMDRGEARGLQKGIQQGLKRGEAQTLLRQIERKFGPQAKTHCQQRVQQADEAQLLQWIDNILTAERLEDVFQNDSSLQ